MRTAHPHERVIDGRTEIARLPSDVFDFLADLANWQRIDNTLVALAAPDRLALGSTGTATSRRAGGPAA